VSIDDDEAKPDERRSDDARSEAEESLPFDVELERLPTWVHVSSALVILVGVLVATHLVHMLVFLPFLEIPRSGVLDGWADEDEVEPRAAVAFGEAVEVAVLHFANREQARRFSEALATDQRGTATHDATNDKHVLVVGHKPRPIDMLSSLRFVAIAAAFLGTGSTFGLFVLLFFALGAWNIVRAKQLVAKRTELEIRTILGVEVHPYGEIENVDVDAGIIQLKSGAELDIPRSTLRDATLASPLWLERARTRVLTRVRAQARR